MKKRYQQKVALVRPVVFGLFGLLILVVSLSLTQKNANLNRQAADEYNPPLEVKIVNVFEAGFSVSWVTKEATRGRVVYSPNQDNVLKNDFTEPKAVDVRGDEAFNTHLINVSGLTAGERYHFKIISNDQAYFLSLDNLWRQSGTTESVVLPTNPGWTVGAYSLETDAFLGCNNITGVDLISCYRPNLVWGRVNNQDNTPAVGALIFTDIPGKSNLLASLTDNNGRWVSNLGNLWNTVANDYAAYQPGIDLIRFSSLAKDAKTSVYQPISSVMNQTNQKTSPVTLTLQSAPLVNPEVTLTPSPTASVTPTVSISPTPTATGTNAISPVPVNQGQLTILFPPKNTATLDGKIELKNKAGRWTTVKITLKKIADNRYQGNFSFNQVGEYEITFHPAGYLKSGLGKFGLTTAANTIESNITLWLAGDINGDNRINMLDLSLLLTNYMKIPQTQTGADFNGDGIINMIDLSLLVNNYNGI